MKGKWLRIESLGNLQSSQSITKRTLECCELKDNQLLKTVICAYSLKKNVKSSFRAAIIIEMRRN